MGMNALAFAHLGVPVVALEPQHHFAAAILRSFALPFHVPVADRVLLSAQLHVFKAACLLPTDLSARVAATLTLDAELKPGVGRLMKIRFWKCHRVLDTPKGTLWCRKVALWA